MAKKKTVKKAANKKPASAAASKVKSNKVKKPAKTGNKSVKSSSPKVSIKKPNKSVAPKSKKASPVTPKATKPAAKKPVVKKVVLAKPSEAKAVSVKKQPEPALTEQTTKVVKKSGRKPVIALPTPPRIEVSNHPKSKVKSILVSQPKPADPEKNPYILLGRKHNLNLAFRQFIKVEPLSSQDFRAQRIDILEHGAVILTSKLSVDYYFKMCNEMRVTVPETMKYFCINEQTAYYLQKYIQYRKRKIFFGHGTILDLVDVIRKNKEEKFLLPCSDVHKEQIVEFLDELHINYTKGVFYKTVCANLSDIKNLTEYDVLVFFTPAGIRSLKQNFPNFKQGNTRIAAFGHAAAQMVKELGYRLDVFAPTPQNPSMSGALDTYIKEANKR